MKILRLLHQTIGICAQEVIRPNFDVVRIKGIWAKKYGKIINTCTYDIYDDNPKPYLIIKNIRTGEVYKDKDEAILSTGLSLNHINKVLGKQVSCNSDYYLVWSENKAI